jgi:hypothetical protein
MLNAVPVTYSNPLSPLLFVPSSHVTADDINGFGLLVYEIATGKEGGRSLFGDKDTIKVISGPGADSIPWPFIRWVIKSCLGNGDLLVAASGKVRVK